MFLLLTEKLMKMHLIIILGLDRFEARKRILEDLKKKLIC